MSGPVHVVVINANCLDPQSIFLFYISYDVNCEWVFFILFSSFFVLLLDVYAGASKLTNSTDLHFIKCEKSAENVKIDTEHETKFH